MDTRDTYQALLAQCRSQIQSITDVMNAEVAFNEETPRSEMETGVCELLDEFAEEQGVDEFTEAADFNENSWGEFVAERVESLVLDAYQEGRRRLGGEWEATSVVYVLCTGGPHVEMDDSGNVTGWWGSHRCEGRIGNSEEAAEFLGNFIPFE
jgi:hypothetical protein